MIAGAAPRSGVCWSLVHRSIGIVWTLGPPSWYLLDARKRLLHGRMPTEEELYFHDAASKFWAGVIAMLAALYSGSFLET